MGGLELHQLLPHEGTHLRIVLFVEHLACAREATLQLHQGRGSLMELPDLSMLASELRRAPGLGDHRGIGEHHVQLGQARPELGQPLLRRGGGHPSGFVPREGCGQERAMMSSRLPNFLRKRSARPFLSTRRSRPV